MAWDHAKQMWVETEPHKDVHLWDVHAKEWRAFWGPDAREAIAVGSASHVGDHGEVCDKRGRVEMEDGSKVLAADAMKLIAAGSKPAVKHVPSNRAAAFSADDAL